MSAKLTLAFASTIALLAPIAGAGAQPAEADTSGGASAGAMEEIVVTARRREERVQSVPIAITAFTGRDVAEKRIATAQDLQKFVPSLIVSSNDVRDANNYTLRGQGSTVGAGPGVVVYFDEVPLPLNISTFANGGGPGLYFDLENIQVLNGPQGTLFGRNTTGGAVLLQPKKPTNNFEGYGQLTLGDYNDQEFEGAINVPVVPDKLLVRAGGNFQFRDGFTKDAVTGKDYDNRDFWAGRVSVTLRPTDDFENDFVYNSVYSHTNGTGTELLAVAPNSRFTRYIPDAFAILAAQQARGQRATVSSTNPLEINYTFSLIDIARWDIADDLALRNLASYQELKFFRRLDDDGSAAPFLDATPNSAGWNTNTGTYTEELQLQGKSLDEHLTWTVGTYLEFYHPVGQQISDNIEFAILHGFGTRGETGNSKAVYGQGTYDLGQVSDALAGVKLTAGYRYSWDFRSDFSQNAIYAGPVKICIVGTAPNCIDGADQHFSAGTWTFGADYRVTQDTLLYAKGSRGYKSGGFNATSSDPLALTFKPEYVTDIELGVKKDWQFGDVKARSNLALFHDDYSNVQRAVPTSAGAAGSATENAAAATIEGIELQGAIGPWQGIELAAAYSYLHAHYDSFVLPDGTDATGLPFEYAPKNKYSVTGTYHLPVDPDLGEVSLSATYSYQSAIWTTALDREPFGYIGGYGLLSFRADWNDVARTGIDAAFFMTNATDQLYRTSNFAVYNSFGYVQTEYGEPRMFGVQLRYQFGPRS